MWTPRYLNPRDAARLELIAELAEFSRPGPNPAVALMVAEHVRSESGLQRIGRDVDLVLPQTHRS